LYATQQQEQQQLQQPTNNTPQVNTSKTPNQVVNNPASSKRVNNCLFFKERAQIEFYFFYLSENPATITVTTA
jgi:hypothetical protein